MRVFHALKNRVMAHLVRFFRTREVLKVFKAGHAHELTLVPVQQWPVTKARQASEIALIKAGKLNITDRKSWAWPFMPQSVYRMSTPVMKTLPYNLRRMSRTPVPRMAINLIKDAIINLNWEIGPIKGQVADKEDADVQTRAKIATRLFERPNNEDSFQGWCEKGLEDYLLLGSFVSEMRLTPDPARPIKMWVVNTESIRIFISWAEDTPEMPRYAQMTGLKGERGAILFYDDEVVYIKDNESSDNPFGLGRMEIAFQSVNDFLAIQRMAGLAGADQIHKTWLWWEQPQTDQVFQILRRHIQNELEGQAKVSLIGGAKKPEIIDVTPVTIEDLLIPWQEMLIRMIGNAFGLSAMALNVTNDVNRAVGQVLADKDFRVAVVPTAKRMQAAFTRQILHRKLGWHDLEFRFVGIDDPDMETQMDLCARMYSSNSITPNEIRKKMSMPPSQSPYSDLTQMESMIIMAQVTANLQDQSADKAMGRQVAMQQMQQPPTPGMGPDGQPDGSGQLPPPNQWPPQMPGRKVPGATQPPNAAQPGQGGAPPSPAGGGGGGAAPAGPIKESTGAPGTGTIKLPKLGLTNFPSSGGGKFPISGSIYSAQEVAQMPLNELADRIQAGQLPKATRLLRDMRAQEPSILEQMSDEVRMFLEDLAVEEQQPDPKPPLALLKKWQKEQSLKLQKQNRRSSNYSEWLYKTGGMSYRGKPVKNVGKPGTPPDPHGL